MRMIGNSFKSNKKYISEADRFLTRFDKLQPQKSTSQEKEIEEYKNLFDKRDKKITST